MTLVQAMENLQREWRELVRLVLEALPKWARR